MALLDFMKKRVRITPLKAEENIPLKSCDLNSAIKQSIKLLITKANHAEIEIDYTPTSVNIEADYLLPELFTNILGNAIKHSKGSIVKISVTSSEYKVRVKVEDDGVGIVPELSEQMFSGSILGHRSKITGLGLYLSKKIISNYHGKIEYRKSDLGGACFDLSFNVSI